MQTIEKCSWEFFNFFKYTNFSGPAHSCPSLIALEESSHSIVGREFQNLDTFQQWINHCTWYRHCALMVQGRHAPDVHFPGKLFAPGYPGYVLHCSNCALWMGSLDVWFMVDARVVDLRWYMSKLVARLLLEMVNIWHFWDVNVTY